MTPRERDPMVWAAAYAAAFVRVYEAIHNASDLTTPEDRIHGAAERTRRCAEPLTVIADAAVLALHPDGTSANIVGQVRTEADRSRDHDSAEAFKATMAALR